MSDDDFIGAYSGLLLKVASMRRANPEAMHGWSDEEVADRMHEQQGTRPEPTGLAALHDQLKTTAKKLGIPTLAERIAQEEINDAIDHHVENVRKSCPGVPSGVLRQMIMNKVGGHCVCAAFKALPKA
jgi:hypothetical protein